MAVSEVNRVWKKARGCFPWRLAVKRSLKISPLARDNNILRVFIMRDYTTQLHGFFTHFLVFGSGELKVTICDLKLI